MENKLEKLLRLAAADPGSRPDFYKALLEEDVFVLTSGKDFGPGETTIREDEQMHLQTWTKSDGSQVIPIFTSLEVMQGSIEYQQNYMRIKGRGLFELVAGAAFVLNPRSQHGKELIPDEIKALLSGELFKPIQPHVVKKEQQVLLGQPQEYHYALVDALHSLFSSHPEVQAAYLALMHMPESEDPPHLLIGIDAGQHFQNVLQPAGMVINELQLGEPVDFVPMDGNDSSLAQYLLTTEPFYKQE